MNAPEVSVIIATRNRWPMLSSNALPSALAQEGVELITCFRLAEATQHDARGQAFAVPVDECFRERVGPVELSFAIRAEDEHARARRDVVGRSHETSPTLGPAPPATIIHIG